MPLYEYECDGCGRFERIRKFSDPPLSACPVCGGAVRKLLSSPAIQFKGSGWYVTDYARKPGGEARDGGKKDGGEKDGANGGGKKDASSAASKDASSAASKDASSAASKSASDSSASRQAP